MLYKVDTTIRNLDEAAYRALRARAVLEGRTVGDVINEAIRAYLARPETVHRRSSLRLLKPEPFPEGTENLSSEIDSVVYGTER
jgi:plasmid stability protein